MNEIDPQVSAAIAAYEAGRYADALALQQALFARAAQEDAPGRSPYFMAMFGFQMLLPKYPPARAAVQALRDEQVRRLLAGEVQFGPVDSDGPMMRKERFSVIVEFNDMLADPQSTSTLFAGFDQHDPASARKAAWRALPALVAAGEWALADRYRGDPLQWLAECNELAQTFPLFPSAGVAPRLGATLMSLVGDVAIGMAVLQGLGDAPAAQALRTALLDGIEDAPMRQLAVRELAEPGTISREVAAHQMAITGT